MGQLLSSPPAILMETEGRPQDHSEPRPQVSQHDATIVQCFLHPLVSLDTPSLQKLKELLKITIDLRRETECTSRAPKGGPVSGALGYVVHRFIPKVKKLSDSIKEISTVHCNVPGMELLCLHFEAFRGVLNSTFNDRKNGQPSRVSYLEKLMYATGILHGHVEAMIDQHTYWKAKLAGTKPSSVVERLEPYKEAHSVRGVRTPFSPPPKQGRQSPTILEHAPDEKVSFCVDLMEYVQSGLAKLWETRRHTDVTFAVGNSRVPAHRAVLAAQSEYFDHLLFGESQECSAGIEVPLSDTPLKAFELLLQYTYCGGFEVKDMPVEEVLGIVKLADRFKFTRLKEAVGLHLAGHVSVGNVLEMLAHGDVFHLPNLHERCLQFIDRNAEQVLKMDTLVSLSLYNLQRIVSRDTLLAPEIAIFEAVLRWKEHNSGTSEEVMSEVLPCIRLSEIPPQEIFNVVEPSGYYDESEIFHAIRAQFKAEVEEVHTRGKKVLNENLFAFSGATLVAQSHVQLKSFTWRSPQAMFEGYVQLDPEAQQGERPATSPRQTGHKKDPSQSSLVISLGDVPYLINNIQFEGYPQPPEDEDDLFYDLRCPKVINKGFSYAVCVSGDQQRWLELVNYSQFDCSSTQHLCFPTMGVRLIRFELTGRKDTREAFTVRFSSCSFADNQKPFQLQENGVMAPLSQITPLVRTKQLTKGDQPACLVAFNQPYSISTLSFKCVPDSYMTRVPVDLVVSVQGGTREKYTSVATLEKQELGKEVVVEFEERAVSSVKVEIKSTIATSSTSQGQEVVETPSPSVAGSSNDLSPGPLKGGQEKGVQVRGVQSAGDLSLGEKGSSIEGGRSPGLALGGDWRLKAEGGQSLAYLPKMKQGGLFQTLNHPVLTFSVKELTCQTRRAD